MPVPARITAGYGSMYGGVRTTMVPCLTL